MPTFTMAAYDNYKDDPFYTLYKKYAFVNENDLVNTDLHLLSANVPIFQKVSFIHNLMVYNILRIKFHILKGTDNDAEKL